MKLLILITLTILFLSDASGQGVEVAIEKEKLQDFQLRELPFALNLKTIKSNHRIPQDSLESRFGKSLPSKVFLSNISNMVIEKKSSTDSQDVVLWPYCRLESENMILVVVYSRANTNAVNDEYYLLVLNREGILKSALIIGQYNADDIGANSAETHIDTNLRIEKNSKVYVNIEGHESCVKRQNDYYQIDPASGEVNRRIKVKKKK